MSMLIDEDLKNLLFTFDEPAPQHKLLVIERFIFDKIGEEVHIRMSPSAESIAKMNYAYMKAKEYYKLEKKWTGS